MEHNKKNIIFHIDVNSAFLSWSAIKLLEEGAAQDIREIPSIVGGDQKSRHGIVVAKSIPAKKYGIHTADTVASAFQKCPGLISVPPEHKYYREKSQQLMDYLASICPVIEQVSIDECYLDYHELLISYPDPISAATSIKDTVYTKFGFTVNVGVSDCKVLAKMASDFKKPNLVHTLYQNEIQAKMWPMPIGKLYMCGKSSSDRLKQMGINTIGDLARMDCTYVESNLKKHGVMLWRYANGMDDSVVNPIKEKAKGVGNSTTLPNDAITKEEAFAVLYKLCKSVSERLKKRGTLAGAICVEIKYSNFESTSHQKQLPQNTSDEKKLYRESCGLFCELWDGNPIRLLGVRTTKLVDQTEPVQMNLFDYGKQIEEDKRKKKLDQVMETISRKYGENVIRKGF